MKIFVYGTLKRKNHLHYYLRNSAFLGEFVTEPLYDLHEDGIPFLTNGQFSILGEVYDVSLDIRERLDALEGHPRHYKRSTLKVMGLDNVEGYIYQCSLENTANVPEDENGIKVW